MNKEYSFKKGFDQVPGGSQPAARQELMAALKIESYPSWLRRLHGKTVPRVDEAKAIESVFAKYGITKNIWGV